MRALTLHLITLLLIAGFMASGCTTPKQQESADKPTKAITGHVDYRMQPPSYKDPRMALWVGEWELVFEQDREGRKWEQALRLCSDNDLVTVYGHDFQYAGVKMWMASTNPPPKVIRLGK